MSVRVINKDFKYQERQSDHDNYCAGFALAAILSDLNGDGTICKVMTPSTPSIHPVRRWRIELHSPVTGYFCKER